MLIIYKPMYSYSVLTVKHDCMFLLLYILPMTCSISYSPIVPTVDHTNMNKSISQSDIL